MRTRSLILGVAASVALAAAAQRYGRRAYDSSSWRELAAKRFEEPLPAFPEIDAGTFFRAQHARCFAQAYIPSWTWNRLDEQAYVRCLNEGYAGQMVQALVLEAPLFAPHTDPRWARLEFTVRLNKGRLPDEMGSGLSTVCDGGGRSFGSSGFRRSEFEDVSPGVYRSHTLVGLANGSCRLELTLRSGSWPLGPPLVVALPTPDPALVRAAEEKREADTQARQRSWQCVLAAKDGLPPLAPAYTDEGQDPLSDAVRRLRSADVSERHAGALALQKLGPAARSALPELVRSLGDTNENSKDYVIQALVAADPTGKTVAPALRCLVEEPTAYVRVRAAAALVACGDPTGLGMLAKELGSADEPTRRTAVRLVREYLSRGRAAVPLLVARLRSDPSPAVRADCARSLPFLDPDAEQVESALRAALKDDAPEVREAASQSLHDLPSLRARR